MFLGPLCWDLEMMICIYFLWKVFPPQVDVGLPRSWVRWLFFRLWRLWTNLLIRMLQVFLTGVYHYIIIKSIGWPWPHPQNAGTHASSSLSSSCNWHKKIQQFVGTCQWHNLYSQLATNTPTYTGVGIPWRPPSPASVASFSTAMAAQASTLLQIEMVRFITCFQENSLNGNRFWSHTSKAMSLVNYNDEMTNDFGFLSPVFNVCIPCVCFIVISNTRHLQK